MNGGAKFGRFCGQFRRFFKIPVHFLVRRACGGAKGGRLKPPRLRDMNTVGATPFFLAAKTADAELMRTLAALGARPLLMNADNSTPLMAAAIHGALKAGGGGVGRDATGVSCGLRE